MKDTICAIATAPGGAIGIVRVSGSDTFPVVCRVCRRITATTPPRVATFTPVIAHDSTLLDEALVTLFPGPHSYTGEDSAELSCHGSNYILNKVLEVLIQEGCRLAAPGEFTQRAFLNGKLDLSQAEAVADLIASTNRATHDIALAQLRGHFSSELTTLRDKLLRLTSLLELELDFSDHEDLEFADRTELLDLARHIDDRVTELAHTFETGQALKHGIPVAIVGKTNVGKSTLLNALVKDERAIVSDIHGTTRDTIEDTMDINGVTFRFIDTAGLRQTNDTIENIGIERTYAAIDKARIILWLFDTPPTASEIADITARTKGRAIIPIFTKADLTGNAVPELSEAWAQSASSLPTPLTLSAKTRMGLDILEAEIFKAAGITILSETNTIVTSARHYEALTAAHTNLTRVINGLTSNLSGDLVAEDLRLTINVLAEITGGAITPQDTLNSIFSHFCVGK